MAHRDTSVSELGRDQGHEAWASRTWAFDSANFLPPLRPRALAAFSPAIVRSRINSRSNSASAAKMPNTRRPAAVVVSMPRTCGTGH